MFTRIANLFRGFLGLFVSGLEKANPEALLEVEKENLRKQIANYNQGLASHAGLCERLMTQVKKLEGEERDLRAKAGANLKAGNRDAAGQYALRLQTVSAQLAENRQQLEAAEKTYQDLLKARDVAVKAARDKIESLKYALTDLKIKRATAEMNEMASGMIGAIGGAGDTLNRLHEMVEEERQVASGRARVAKDSIDMGDIQIKEAEQKALADQALADFAAKEGISLGTSPEPDGSAPEAERTMG
ncbi:MAG TPA: PspA/IM30 family protein [Chthoniobacterales bacterium]|jgi:phage shock protein A